jgi:hypothetical protein
MILHIRTTFELPYRSVGPNLKLSFREPRRHKRVHHRMLVGPLKNGQGDR